MATKRRKSKRKNLILAQEINLGDSKRNSKQKGIIDKGAKFICEECIAKSKTIRVPEDDDH